MSRAMTDQPPRDRLILVSCVGCGSLHEPVQPMAFNPRCPACAAPQRQEAPTPELR